MLEQIVRGIIGVFVLIAVAVAVSVDRKAIRWKPVGYGLFLNFFFAYIVLRTPPGRSVFEAVSQGLTKIIEYANEGTKFVFGPLYTGFSQIPHFDGWPFAFVLDALVPIVFFAALIKIFYFYGIMQRIIGALASLFVKVFGINSVEALVTASNVFLGQTQAPLVIAPYLKRLTRSQLFLTMVGGMATVGSGMVIVYAGMGATVEYVLAASIMAAPAAIVFSKIIVPETENADYQQPDEIKGEHGVNVLDALAIGGMEGWKAVVGVSVMLLAFIPLIHLLDGIIAFATVSHLSLGRILQFLFTPAAYIVGVPSSDIGVFANLIGSKTAFNEVIGFSGLKGAQLSPKGFMLACFAMTGFANFSSIAIQVGCIGEITPERRSDVARLGMRALLAATLANLLNAAIAGILFQ